MKKFLITFFCCFGYASGMLFAQLPNGSTAPDFTTTDINGNTHNLYEYLEQGKTVILKFTATWCGPCWNYHQSGALEDTWEQFGPPGTDEAIVLFIESDPNTPLDCLYGNCPNTLGDWVTGTPFPQINDHNMANPYAISYYPTIYGVCPNKEITLLGQVPASVIGSFIDGCKNITYNALVNNISCFGENNGSILLEDVSAAEPTEYLWSNGSTESFIENLAPGMYNCTISDPFGNSVVTQNFIVQEPEFLSIDVINISNIDCYNDEGYASVMAVGGNQTFQFSWSNGQTGNELYVGEGGTFVVSVVDDKGCTNELEVEVEENNELPQISAGQDKTLGCNDISIQLEGEGPMGIDFQIEWTTQDGEILSGESTYSPTVVLEGTYLLNVLNTLTGCEATSSVNVNSSEGPQFVLTTQSISCFGANNGSAALSNLTPANATIAWSTGSNSLAIQNLSPGNYFVTISDGPCQSIENFSINQPDSLQLNLTLVNESGEGNSDGSITAIAIGGTSPYSYQWSNGGQGAVLDSLSPGLYVLTLTDSNGCFVQMEGEITSQICDLSLNLEIAKPISCYNGEDGEIMAIVEGDTSGIVFNWSNGEEGNAIQNLGSGIYSLTVTNENNCSSTQSIELSDQQMIMIEFAFESESELGAMDGNINAMVSGGTSPYSLEWSNGIIDTTEINFLSNGEYCLTVTDSNNCTTVACVTLENNECNLSIEIEVLQPLQCFGDSTGVIAVNITGNTGPVNILWNSGDMQEVLANLVEGMYTVIVTDSLGCTSNAQLQLDQPTKLTIEFNAEKPSTPTSNDGTLSIIASGGNHPYTVLWDNGSNDSIINGNAGVYCVTITDSNSCSVAVCESIPEAGCNDLTIVANIIHPVICKGTETGAVEFIVSGGYPEYFIAFSQSNLNALKTGEYFAVVSDVEGCIDTVGFIIQEPEEELDIVFTYTPSIAVQGTGTVEVEPLGGWGDYFVKLEKESTIIATQQDKFDNLQAGSYLLSITDREGCEIERSFEIELNTSQNLLDSKRGSITIFPNPANGRINWINEKNIPIQSLSINTPQGRILKVYDGTSMNQTNHLDIGDIPSGLYIIMIELVNGDRDKIKLLIQ
jgi:hypothetical protein